MRHPWALIIITVAPTASALILSDYQQSGHLLAPRAFAQHPPAAGPNQVNTEIDNATTTVLRIRLAPHVIGPTGVPSPDVVFLIKVHAVGNGRFHQMSYILHRESVVLASCAATSTVGPALSTTPCESSPR
jgi:hypothetical protein